MLGSMSAWRRGGRRSKALALAALMVWLGERTAAGDAGPETDNALATICGIVESSAMAEGLPVGFFTRLIWRESAFKPDAVSPAGAEGVAQFMPRTASERGLANPFDPAAAIPESAKLLGELELRFGNLGLAAAAYNAGTTAVDNWLAGKSDLPFETQDYVLAITGYSAEDWRGPTPPSSASPVPAAPCLSVVASLRTGPQTASPVVSGLFAPWGVQVAGSFSKDAALAEFARAEARYAKVIGGMDPFVLGSALRSRGFRPFYRVRLPAQSRAEAQKICARLEAAGGACVVLRS
jgi:Transglycosylase SLT domain/SPOR domain